MRLIINSANMEKSVSLEEIKKFKNDFINDSKTVFNKKKIKIDASKCVCENYDLIHLLDKTVYIITDEINGKLTNKIWIDYLVFKLYANPENYEKIIIHILRIFDVFVEQNCLFEIHLNLKSFTVSSAERYKLFIETFAKECLKTQTKYSCKISKIVIMNTPSVIDFISKIFNPWIDPELKDRFHFVK